MSNDGSDLTSAQKAAVVKRAAEKPERPKCQFCNDEYAPGDKFFISEHRIKGKDVALSTWHFECPMPQIADPKARIVLMKMIAINWVEDMNRWAVEMILGETDD